MSEKAYTDKEILFKVLALTIKQHAEITVLYRKLMELEAQCGAVDKSKQREIYQMEIENELKKQSDDPIEMVEKFLGKK